MREPFKQIKSTATYKDEMRHERVKRNFSECTV